MISPLNEQKTMFALWSKVYLFSRLPGRSIGAALTVKALEQKQNNQRPDEESKVSDNIIKTLLLTGPPLAPSSPAFPTGPR